MTPDMEEAAKLIKEGMESNGQDSPQLSIDPDTQKLAVVGDPNQVQPTNGYYKLTFLYSADELSEADKENMKFREDTEEYEVTIEYKGKRVKPLYRQKIDLLLADIFEGMGVLGTEGYNPDAVKNTASLSLMSDIDKVADIAYMVCDIPKDQVLHLDPFGLADFLNQLLVNEPNILKESVAFLTRRLQQQQKSEMKMEKKKQSIQQD